MSKIDLHIHSNFSLDGEFSVETILAMCKESEMELVSIADHNSVKSVNEIPKGSKGIRIISGVELDCDYKGINFHLLGFGFDHSVDDYNKIGEDIICQEREASAEKIRLFNEFTGIPVNAGEILATSKTGVVTGELIAEHVLSMENASDYEILQPYLPGGERSGMPNAYFYWDFFSPGKPAHVPIHNISIKEGIDLIHRTSGVAVLAHPGQSLGGNYDLLNGIIAQGIDGIEVFSSYHSSEDAVYFLSVAKQEKLLISCGSDFHGKNKPNIQLGSHGATIDDRELLESFMALELPFL